MELNTFFFSTCFILCSSAPPFNRQKAMDQLNKELSYIPTDKQLDFLKEKFIDKQEEFYLEKEKEKIGKEKSMIEIAAEMGKEIQKKNIADAKVKKFVIPLTVRDYAVLIEERFPEIMKGTVTVPANVLKDTKPYKKYFIERQYKWDTILQKNKNDDYVKLIIEELDKNFMMENKLEKIEENSENYKKYRLEFCKSVVTAIDHTNKMIAHAKADEAGWVKYDMILFDKVVDKYMVMFYNALLVKSDSETTTPEKI